MPTTTAPPLFPDAGYALSFLQTLAKASIPEAVERLVKTRSFPATMTSVETGLYFFGGDKMPKEMKEKLREYLQGCKFNPNEMYEFD